MALFEHMLADSGFIVLKYYLDISRQEQHKRLQDRKRDPLKQWKLSPIDAKAQKLWKAYSGARNTMLLKTNYRYAPWYIANAENKNDVRVALITHLLRQVSYTGKNTALLKKDDGLIFPATPGNILEKLYK